MIQKEEFSYDSKDKKTSIHAIKWIPDTKILAVLQISHGMVEYINRYDEFALFLAERGILVAGNDHLGHGSSVRSEEDYGYFCDLDGNTVILRDIHRLKKIIQEQYPGLPYYLLGHSMGSFLLRQYITRYGKGIDGAIIMGTGNQHPLLIKTGIFLTSFIARFKGWHYRSRLVDNMAFGGYNKKFKPSRTGKEWLTKDEAIVDRYVADKRCTFMFTLNGYYNLFISLLDLTKPETLKKMPTELPILFTSGNSDPVGGFGTGVEDVYLQFKDLGMENVFIKLYENDRHEILNESDRQTVYNDIYIWLLSRMKEYEMR